MTKSVAEIICIVGLVAWFVIRQPFMRRSKKLTVVRSLDNWFEHVLIAIAVLGQLVVPLIYIASGFPKALDYEFSPALGWIGGATLLLSLWLFYFSHTTLGANFSSSLKVRQAHTLVQDGPYRWIRHPMYTSFLLQGLAQFFLLPNWFAGCAGLLCTAILFAFRVEREERMMSELFQSEYPAYKAKTKKIIPWIY